MRWNSRDDNNLLGPHGSASRWLIVCLSQSFFTFDGENITAGFLTQYDGKKLIVQCEVFGTRISIFNTK